MHGKRDISLSYLCDLLSTFDKIKKTHTASEYVAGGKLMQDLLYPTLVQIFQLSNTDDHNARRDKI